MLKPKIIVSRCFLYPVRYNGEAVNDEFVEKLKNYVDFIDICPEFDIGLGVPRAKIIVIQNGEKKRLIQPETGKDLTEFMSKYINKTLRKIKEVEGFLLKAKSPLCGVSSTKLYSNAVVIGKTDGFFAEALKKQFPYLPIEDEIKLKNEEVKHHFLTRIFAFSEFRQLLKKLYIQGLVEFHSRYKYLLMTYSQRDLKELGQILVDEKMSLNEKIQRYKEIFYQAFKRKPSRSKHVNILIDIVEHISKNLTDREKKHLFNLIEKYRKGSISLKVILALIRSFSYRFENDYLFSQKYLNPFPQELY